MKRRRWAGILLGSLLAAYAGWVTTTVLAGPAGNKVQESGEQSRLVYPGPDGHLVYKPWNEHGDTIPDFSNCGYGGGGVPLPDVPVRQTLEPKTGGGDDLPRLQATVDALAKLPRGADGFRGALLLKRGEYRLSDSLTIHESGIVIRGEGNSEGGTVLHGIGKKQEPLIAVTGKLLAEEKAFKRQQIADTYVPVGARTFTVADASGLKAGDTILVIRHGNAAFIHELGMDHITPRASDPNSTKQWQPFDLQFDRVVTARDGNKITVDAPLTCAVDQRWGGGEVARYDNHPRIEKVGVENLAAISDFDRSKKAKEGNLEYFSDEDHASYIVQFTHTYNGWARNLTAKNLTHGVVTLNRGAKWITVQDCKSSEPVSVITGGRRYPYQNSGQLCLVQRCWSRDARHAFVIGGGGICGPNVFLDCRSESDHATSEPHQRWSVGGLYDNVEAQMAFQDRQWMGSGHGWSGANYVVWNGKGSVICQQPPTAQNFVIGFVGKKGKAAFPRTEGWTEAFGKNVAPRSLYLQQLKDRLGPN